MANSDKDILITPNSGSSSADPKIEYVGANSSGNDTITVETLYDGTKATLSFEGSAGQLFSVVNDLSSDPIFSVNDVSGIPSIEVDSDGEIRLAEFNGKVGVRNASPQANLHIGPLTGGNGAAQERLRISGDYTATGSGSFIRFTNQHDSGTNPNSGEYNIAGIKAFDFRSDWGGALALQTAPNTSTGGNLTDRLVINPEGDVGINTSNPASFLHVHGTQSYGTLRISPTSTNGESAMAFFLDTNATTTSTAWVVGHAGWGNTGDFVIGNQANGGPVILAQQDGKVGIGTTSPGSLLDVDGRITANNLTLQNLSGQSSEATAVMIDGSGIIGTRELGSNAFNSTTIPSLSGYATESYVTTQINNLIDSAPGALNTLNELAAAINDDASFSTTVTNSIATKLPLAGGTMTGDISMNGNDVLGASKITLNMNPVGTSYGGTSSATPANMISQVVGSNDGWRLYGEGASNDVQMIFEIIDDLETGDTWIFRNKKTYSDYSTRNEFIITGEGTFKSRGNGYVNTSQRVFADNYHPNADKWTTARTITLGGDLTGNVSIDGSANVTLTAAVVDDSHNHVISNVDGLQTALDGKLSTSGTAANSQLLDSMDSTRFLFGSGTTGTNIQTVTNWNSPTKSGFYSDDGASNKWSTANWSSIIHIKLYDSNNNYASQLGFDTYNPDLYYRMQNNGTWTSWYEIYHEGHKPTYSELGTMAYSNLTGTPTIPTNNNQLTNGAGYITSFDITTQTDPKYLRSNADDTVTAGTTYTWSATDTQGLVFENSSYNKKLYIGGWSSANSSGISRIRNSNDNLHLDSGSAGNLYLNHYSAGNVYARQNLIWHAGNDGSGSGLDADTLDGYQATALPYTPINDFNSLGTTAFTAGGGSNSTMTTAQYISEMEGDGAFDSFSSVFKTTWSYAGNDNISDAGSFGPTETAGMSHITWTDNSSDSTRGNITVLAIAPNTGGSAGGVYVYNDQGSSYAPGWREIWTSSTDGAGSGLDSDLLDGQHGSHYLNYNNFTNTPTIPTNNNQLTNGAGYTTFSSNQATNNNSSVTFNTVTTSNNGNGTNVRIGDDVWLGDVNVANTMSIRGNQNAANGFIIFGNANTTALGRTGSGALTYGGNTVWHAGNDGSGSGLDADTLDGVNSGSFLRSDANDTASGSYSFTNSYNEFGNNTGAVSNDGSWNARVNISGTSHARMDLFEDANDSKLTLFTHTGQNPHIGSMSGHDVEFIRQNVTIAQLKSNGLLLRDENALYFDRASDGGSDLSTKIYADDYPDAGYNNIAQKYWLALESKGGCHIILNSDGSTSASENSFDHFTIFQDLATHAGRQFYVTNVGNVHAKGDVIAFQTSNMSDIRLKKNIQPLVGSLEKIKQLQGVSFDWKDETKGSSIGFVAQDFEKIIPELIKETPDINNPEQVNKSINYGNVVGLLVEAMKEQQEIIEKLTSRINDIEKGE